MNKLMMIVCAMYFTASWGQTSKFTATFENGGMNADIGLSMPMSQYGGSLYVAKNPKKDNVNGSENVLKAVLPAGSKSRAEFHNHTTTRFRTNEKKHFYSWKVYYPEGFLEGIDNISWLNTAQWKTYPCQTNGEGIYDFTEEIAGKGGIFNDIILADKNTLDFHYRALPDEASVYYEYPKGQWVNYIYEIYWTNSDSGYYRLYANNKLIGKGDKVKTLFDGFIEGSCDMYFGVGLYSGWTSATVDSMYYYIDDVNVYLEDDGVSIKDICPDCEVPTSITTPENKMCSKDTCKTNGWFINYHTGTLPRWNLITKDHIGSYNLIDSSGSSTDISFIQYPVDGSGESGYSSGDNSCDFPDIVNQSYFFINSGNSTKSVFKNCTGEKYYIDVSCSRQDYERNINVKIAGVTKKINTLNNCKSSRFFIDNPIGDSIEIEFVSDGISPGYLNGLRLYEYTVFNDSLPNPDPEPEPEPDTISVPDTTIGKNQPPIISISNEPATVYGGVQYTLNAEQSYDLDGNSLTFNWIIPNETYASILDSSEINFLVSDIKDPITRTFILEVSDGNVIAEKSFDIVFKPYKPEYIEIGITSIEASSYEPTFYPENVLDNNMETRWSSEGVGEWISLTLERPVSVNYIKVAFFNREDRKAEFDIYASKDGISWESAINNLESCGFSDNNHVFDIPSIKAAEEYKYIRLVGKGNSIDEWNSISELKVYGSITNTSDNRDVRLNDIVEIYPNPISDYFYVTNENVTQIKIYNVNGKLVYDEQLNAGKQNLIDLLPGTYVIQAYTKENNILTNKIVVK